MKRIISVVMSILMIMTMFCGVLSVGSVADVYEDQMAQLAAYDTLMASSVKIIDEDPEDNLIDVQLWVKDMSPVGTQINEVYLSWDETKVAPVTLDYTGTSGSYEGVAFDITELKKYIYDSAPDKGWAIGTTHDYVAERRVVQSAYVTDEDSTVSPFKFSLWGSVTSFSPVDYSYEAIIAAEDYYEAYYTYTEADGLLWAQSTFEIKEGATGDVVFNSYFGTMAVYLPSAEDNTVASDVYIDVNDGRYDYDKVDEGSATYKLGGETTSALPEGMTVTVSDEASVRTTTDYTGIRFTTTVTVTDKALWGQVAEMGTVIVRTGDHPSTDGVTKLEIPARVENVYGNYIQDRSDSNSTEKFETGLNEYAQGLDSIIYTGVLSEVLPQNYSKNFDAYAYIELTNGDVVYSQNFDTASMKTVCEAAANDDLSTDEAKAKAQAIIDYYESQLAG